jgi:hypothetical protein
MLGFVSWAASSQEALNISVLAGQLPGSKHPRTFERCSLAHFPPMSESEQLLNALRQCGDQLALWISKSPANACLLIEDPAAAIEAATAPTELDLDTMRELESVLTSLAQKLHLPPTIRIEPDLSKTS